MSVDKSSCALTEAELQDPELLDRNTTVASPKLLPKSKRPYSVRSVTDTVLHLVRKSVTMRGSVERTMKVPAGSYAAQLPATTGDGAKLEATVTRAATGVGATVQNSRGTVSATKNEEKHITEKLVGHSRTETDMQYRAPWYAYNPLEDAYQPA